jgi:cell division protein FtsA
MGAIKKESVTVSIDIGTTKICVLVAHKKTDGSIDIIAVGRSPSHGLKKGVVVDIAKTVQSIQTAVKEAEFISGFTIESAAVGISGSHIQSFNSQGMAPIKKGIVKEYDIANALESARAIAIPEGQQILHVLPKYFSIDGQDRILDPLNMAGIRLETYVHIITGSISSVQNIVQCCQLAGITATDIVLEQLASAQAVLTPDERELGVAVLDIGGGTSDFAIYQNGSIRHTKVIPLAGNQFTNDLAIGLQTSIAQAQQIKELFGISHPSLVPPADEAIISVGEPSSSRKINQKDLLAILQPRSEEIMLHVKQEVEKQHLKPFMSTGLVLTGGGSLLPGIDVIAREIIGVPVRLGKPETKYLIPESLSNPIYATGYGLLLHAMAAEQTRGMEYLDGPLTKKIILRMKSWVSDFF